MNPLFLAFPFLAALAYAQIPAAQPPFAYLPRMTDQGRIDAVEQCYRSNGKAVEAMVHESLKLLLTKQNADGSFGKSSFPLNTGLAVLAIVGDGKSIAPERKAALEKAVAWLKKKGEEYEGHMALIDEELENVRARDGNAIRVGPGILHIRSHPELTPNARRFWPRCDQPVVHAIVTQSLAEYVAVEGDATLKPLISKAVEIILDAQQDEGGWDEHFEKKGPPNMWTSAYQVKALRSAALIDLGGERLPKALAATAKFASDWSQKGRAGFLDERGDLWSGLLVAAAADKPNLKFTQNDVRTALRKAGIEKLDLFATDPKQRVVGPASLDNLMPAAMLFREGIADDCYSAVVRNLAKNHFPHHENPIQNDSGLTTYFIKDQEVAQFAIVVRALEAPFLFVWKK